MCDLGGNFWYSILREKTTKFWRKHLGIRFVPCHVCTQGSVGVRLHFPRKCQNYSRVQVRPLEKGWGIQEDNLRHSPNSLRGGFLWCHSYHHLLCFIVSQSIALCTDFQVSLRWLYYCDHLMIIMLSSLSFSCVLRLRITPSTQDQSFVPLRVTAAARATMLALELRKRL